MIRVSIVAPTPMMRAGLRAMLSTGDIEVIGEAPSLAELVTEPSGMDVLVVTVEGLLDDKVQAIVGDGAVAVVVLSEDSRPAAALAALPLRGWGIVSPDAPAAELRAAVAAAAQGLVALSMPLGRQVLNPRALARTLDDGPLDEPLTGRELEVLELLSRGLPNKLIARKLQISEHTVKFHVSSLYTKLGASSRTDAVTRGARRGLITL